MGLNQSHLLSLRFLIAKQRRLGPQNGPGSSGIEKLLKIVSCQKNCFERVRQGGWPPRSSWINNKYVYGWMLNPNLTNMQPHSHWLAYV
jgi:hypothetical protein